MKILINTPDLSRHGGGVANHYLGLLPYWKEDVTYNVIGKRNNIKGQFILIYDYIKFIFLCAFGNYDVVLLNPSLGKTAIKRDALFLKISKLFKIKTIVFFHGWEVEIADGISKKPKKFIRQFNNADAHIVLASSFKEQLNKWGITAPIYLSSTKINDRLLKDFNFEKKPFNENILFLARVEENKGIFIVLKAFQQVLNHYPHAKLNIAGNGSALEKAKKFVEKEKINHIEFLGNISGQTLTNLFINSSIYILPTTHGEGMPTSVLEAMAFGLPIISRPVGGMVDFFEEDIMGYLTESLKPDKYAEKLMFLLAHPKKWKEISKYNSSYAQNKFLASKVVMDLEKILIQKHD